MRIEKKASSATLLLALAACLAAAEARPGDAASTSSALAAPPAVFQKPSRDYAVAATIATSDGRSAAGLAYTTLGKPMTIYDREGKKYVEFALRDIARIEVAVEEENEEKVWHWKESGSDEKVYTGQLYPWRKYLSIVTFADGRGVTGDMSGMVYLDMPAGSADSAAATASDMAAGGKGAATRRYLFHKRQKGEAGQSPAALVYVTSLEVSGASGPNAADPAAALP